jgi:hypothetical protein
VQKLLDFDVVIESHDEGYLTRVIASPAGEAQAGFAFPFTDKDLKILILEVVGSIGRQRRNVRRIESQDRQLLEDFGNQLFQAVFSGSVADCLGRSRMAAANRDAGLRIRLRLPGTLANIPWEYLYDAEHGFLGLDPETALVRYIELPAPVRPFPVSPPLRILAMISAPSDVPPLETEEEWAKLNDTLGDLAGRGLVKVDRLENGTLRALQRPLRLNDYHVLHFIGHGRYDENAQDGALALEDADGKTRLVTGRDLGMMIRQHRSLRLVVLNACEGGRNAPDDPFGGVAQALVRQGIPAVIAMQFEISDPAALAFSQSFYQAVADRLPVDVATVEARRAMFAEGNEIEWATPVLYLRSTDGRVFTRGRGPQAEPRAQEEAETLGRVEAERRDREQAERQARQEAERRDREQADRQTGEEPERRDPIPLPVTGPIVLSVPLFILALKLIGSLDKPWSWAIVCSAILGGVVAAVEHRRRRIPVWTVALEFYFVLFLIYGIVLTNSWHIRSRLLHDHVPSLAILAGVGAIFGASLCIRALVKAFRQKRTTHPILPALLLCMAVGLCSIAIVYTSHFFPTNQTLATISLKFTNIGAAFLLLALLVSLLAPLLTLVRTLQGPKPAGRHR